jgi:predicted Rdx family selenoprotein
MAEIAIEYAAGNRLRSEAETARRLIDAYLGDRPDVDRVTLSPSGESVFCVSVEGDRIWCTDPREWIDSMEAVTAARRRLSEVS